MFLFKPKYTEDYRTILTYIMKMPEVTRHEFYKSVEGQNILKGLFIEAENDKSPKDSSGASRKWDAEELDKIIKELHNASPEQREALLQILPGPAIATILARTQPIEGEGDKKVVKGMGNAVPGAGTGVRGPQKGTPGYEQWKEKLRATRAAKRKTPLPSEKTGPSEKQFSSEKKIGTHSKEKKGPDGYKHFVRQIGEHGEIHDNPIGRKQR